MLIHTGGDKGIHISYNLRIFILVGVGLHVPDDLMGEELREFGSLNNVALYVSERIISKSLDDLWYVEECDIDGVALESPHGVLKDEWVASVGWKEVVDGGYGIHWCPI